MSYPRDTRSRCRGRLPASWTDIWLTTERATEERTLGGHRRLLQVGLYPLEAAAFGLGDEGADEEQEGEDGDDGVAEEGDAGSDGPEEHGKV